MDYYTFLAKSKDGDLYLTDMAPVNFSNNLSNSIKFNSEKIAKSSLYDRFLSLSNWIYNEKNKIDGIFLVFVKDNIIKERKRFL